MDALVDVGLRSRYLRSMKELQERATPGLHDAAKRFLGQRLPDGRRACDLGAGTGAWAGQLMAMGFDVMAVDLDTSQWRGQGPVAAVDLNACDFASKIPGSFNLVTAIEVIEHMEAPVRFLRNVQRLLAPLGVALLTTPNMDSLPARVKFAVKGTLRQMDRWSDPTHISPIFLDLLHRQYLPRAGLELVERALYPEAGFVNGRSAYTKVLAPFGPLLAVGRNRRRQPSVAIANVVRQLGELRRACKPRLPREGSRSSPGPKLVGLAIGRWRSTFADRLSDLQPEVPDGTRGNQAAPTDALARVGVGIEFLSAPSLCDGTSPALRRQLRGPLVPEERPLGSQTRPGRAHRR